MNKNVQSHDDFYNEICNKYFKDVYEFYVYLTKGDKNLNDMVEECTQETFLEAKKQIEKLRKHPNIKGWLYVTAKNLINSSFRKYYIKNKYEITVPDEIICSSKIVLDELEKVIDDEIDVDKLKVNVLEQLKEGEYQFYIDFFVEKKSVKEMAEKHNISVSAIYTRIYRLKLKIKKIAVKEINQYIGKNM